MSFLFINLCIFSFILVEISISYYILYITCGHNPVVPYNSYLFVICYVFFQEIIEAAAITEPIPPPTQSPLLHW